MITATQLQQIKTYFISQPVTKAYLFGSQTGADATPQSDIDILVEVDYAKLSAWDFIDMQLDLNKLLQTKVDLVSSDGVSKHILPFIEKQKMLIYER